MRLLTNIGARTERGLLVSLPRRVLAMLVVWGPGAASTLLWATIAIVVGVAFMMATVVLPPTGAFGLVLVAALVLLWVMPDLRTVPDYSVRVLFFIMVVVVVCVPNYYTIQVSELPWISIRRISLFPMIVLFGLAFSGSSTVRSEIKNVLLSSKIMTYSSLVFFASTWLSVLTSIDISTNVSNCTDAALSWYAPWMVTAFVVRSEADVRKVMKILCHAGVIVCLVGIFDFLLERRIALDLIPESLLEQLMENNDSLARMVNDTVFRNGLYRASSVFGVSLCFGEFAAIIAPLGAFFLVYGRSVYERLLGAFCILVCALGVYSSGARGGYMSIAAALGAFTAIWCLRAFRMERRPLTPVVISVIALIVALLCVGLVTFWTKAHNLVLGGGYEQYSTDARFQQWELALPFMISNPLTGHGFELGAIVIGNGSSENGYTIDSYILSLLVEDGVIGFVSFTVMLFSAIWMGVLRFLTDRAETGPMNGALACSVIAFTVYRTVLSQHENHTLCYIILALLLVSSSVHKRRLETNNSFRKAGAPALAPAS